MLNFREELNNIQTTQREEEEKKIEQAANQFFENLLKSLKQIDISSIKKLSFCIIQNNIIVEKHPNSSIIFKQTHVDISTLKMLEKISKILKENEYTLQECGHHSFAIYLHNK